MTPPVEHHIHYAVEILPPCRLRQRRGGFRIKHPEHYLVASIGSQTCKLRRHEGVEIVVRLKTLVEHARPGRNTPLEGADDYTPKAQA